MVQWPDMMRAKMQLVGIGQLLEGLRVHMVAPLNPRETSPRGDL